MYLLYFMIIIQLLYKKLLNVTAFTDIFIARSLVKFT
jgi:hypothetical protein